MGDLIVCDDIGMLPVGPEAVETFYRVIDAAYERRSIAVTSKIHLSGFDTIMPETWVIAAMDRLLYHAHLALTQGDSHRLAEALAGKGVMPLAWPPTRRTTVCPTGPAQSTYPKIPGSGTKLVARCGFGVGRVVIDHDRGALILT
ncbi:ATP-binding protein [Nocardia sp. NPDC050630]|uniref:ATP-binding protein n=1 Tax=Nocardia sp. NPDC050630 TaxID=3364321 RepID=UPI003797D19D